MVYSEYLTTTFDNPYDYYWKQINKSLDAMTKKEETKTKYINHFKSMLTKEAEKLGVDITSNKLLAQLCYKACQAVLMEAVLTFGKPPHVAYALEYFVYAPTLFDLGENTRSVNFDLSAYYNQLVTRLESTLTKECNANILNNVNGGISNNIIDLDRLRKDLRQIVATFYEHNPELKQSTDKMPELQYNVTKLFSKLSIEFDKKNKLNKPINNNFSF
ncbi:MAG: hypothetical protein IJ371_03205 [Clostridia bacterium]|nr:hypothetical protein [Clostridia bacterium]